MEKNNNIKSQEENTKEVLNLVFEYCDLCDKIDYLEVRNPNNLSSQISVKNFKIFWEN